MPGVLDEIDAFVASKSRPIADDIDAFIGQPQQPLPEGMKRIPTIDPRQLEPLTMGEPTPSLQTVGDMRMASPERTAAMFDEFERPQRERAAMMKSIGADEPSILDEMANFITAPIRGAASGVRQQFRGIEAATPGKAPFSKSMADGIADFMAEYLPGDPTQQGDIGDVIGEAAGSSIPLLAQGAAAGPIGLAAGGALMQGGGAYEEALAATGDEATAKFVGRLNMPLGAIEGILGGERTALKLLSRIDDTVGGGLARAIKGMGKDIAVGGMAEAGENVIQQAGSEGIAKAVYAKDRKFSDILMSVAQAGLIGGATGGLINAVASGLGRYKARRRAQRDDRTATPDMASEFIADYPDAAKAIAEASTAPSRKDYPSLPSSAERSRLQTFIRNQLSAPKAEMRPIPVVPASEQGPLTLAEKPNESEVQRQGEGESIAQGQETPEAGESAPVLESGPTATAEPVLPPQATGQPVVEPPTPKGLYSQAAVERRLDAATREHKEMISGDDAAAPRDIDAEGGEEGESVRSHWTFGDTPQGKAAAKELRNQLPPEWKHLAMNIQTKPHGKAEDIRHNIGDQAMLDGMIRWHKGHSPKSSRTTTANFIDKHQHMFTPQDVYAAKQFLGLVGAGKGEKPKMYKTPQMIDADTLGVGDKVEVAETPFTVKGIDPDTGVASLEDHGENLEVAQGGKLAIDPGSLKQKTRSADFTAPTGPTGLFNQETFETQTGSQQTMAFGTENAIGEGPKYSGTEAKIRKQYDEGGTKPLFGAEKARKEFGDALDEFGKYLEGRQFTGAIFDPEIYKLAAKVVGKGVVAGYRTFNEFVRDVATKIGTDRARRLMPALRDEWKKAKATTTDLDEPGEVDFAGVVEPTKPQIRPDLSNPAEGTAAQGLVESVDAARNLADTPDVRADVDVRTAAEAMLRNPAAVRKTVLDRSQDGKDLSDVETAAAKRLLVQEATKAVLSGDEKAITEAMTLANAYRQTGTEQGRAFRQRQNLGETDEEFRLRSITEAVLTPPEGVADVEWAKQAAVVREYLKERGFDLSLIETLVKNPVTTAQVLGEIHAFKSPRSDKLFEYWRNSILSAPTTQAANILGNTGNAAWDMTAQRFVEATVNTFGKRPGDASFGEFKHMLRGMLPGISRGARNFLTTWRSEVPTFDLQMGRTMNTKLETPNIHIKGKLGKAIRIPQRALLAFDEFAKSMIWEMQVAAHAYRIAKSEGLTGKAMASRIQELAMDTSSKAADAAYNDALRLTFQDHTGKILQYALAARKDIPGLRYLMPFVTTPVNILRTGLRKSPLGALQLAHKIIKAVQTGNYDGITPRIAEQVIAWAVLAAFMGNDPDDPWITGSASELDRRTREFSQRQGTPPTQSIRIGNTWVSYARIEPAATALSLIVDTVDAWKKQGVEGVATKPLESVLGQLENKTFLRGIGDMMNAVREHNLESVAQWASNFATSWVPNIVRAGSRATKENVPERSTWARGPEWRERFGKRLVQKTELGIIADQPRYDVWGRPVKYGTSPVPGTDWLYRMLSPLNVKMSEPFVGDIAIMNWNNAHPDDEWFPSMPQKYFTKGGKQTYMSDEKFAAYSKEYGERARKKVEAYYSKPLIGRVSKPDPFNPTKYDMDAIKKRRTAAGEEARNAIK